MQKNMGLMNDKYTNGMAPLWPPVIQEWIKCLLPQKCLETFDVSWVGTWLVLIWLPKMISQNIYVSHRFIITKLWQISVDILINMIDTAIQP